jgi:hypothetical protein
MASTGLDARITEAVQSMSQQTKSPIEIIRKMLPYTTVAACLALIYMGWIFYSRSSQNRELQQQAEEKSLEQDRKNYEMYGSGQLKIMLFYAAPPVVARGGATKLCYSVSNATSVKIEPDVAAIKPSLSRCEPVTPAHSTTYILSASDDKGHTASQKLDVVVR